MTKKRLIDLLSGLVDTFTLCIVNSNSHSFCTTSEKRVLTKDSISDDLVKLDDRKKNGGYDQKVTIEKACAIQ